MRVKSQSTDGRAALAGEEALPVSEGRWGVEVGWEEEGVACPSLLYFQQS